MVISGNPMPSSLEIAQSVTPRPIIDIARELGLRKACRAPEGAADLVMRIAFNFKEPHDRARRDR